jgi:hypothetical protein
MIDISQFSALQKKSKSSFAEQKQIMKKVMAGQRVLCPTCQQPLYLSTPKRSADSKNEKLSICCKKGCTDIQLDIN